jgi:hypothetical protein
MEEVLIKLALATYTCILTVLLGIVGYFLKQLVANIGSLTKTVEALELVVKVNSAGCDYKHDGVDEKIENHEKRITKL